MTIGYCQYVYKVYMHSHAGNRPTTPCYIVIFQKTVHLFFPPLPVSTHLCEKTAAKLLPSMVYIYLQVRTHKVVVKVD